MCDLIEHQYNLIFFDCNNGTKKSVAGYVKKIAVPRTVYFLISLYRHILIIAMLSIH